MQLVPGGVVAGDDLLDGVLAVEGSRVQVDGRGGLQVDAAHGGEVALIGRVGELHHRLVIGRPLVGGIAVHRQLQGAGLLGVGQQGQLGLHLLGVLAFHLGGQHLGEGGPQVLVAHPAHVAVDLLLADAHLLGEDRGQGGDDLLPAHAAQHLVYLLDDQLLVGQAHDLDVDPGLARLVQAGDIIPQLLFLFRFGQAVRPGGERQPGQDVPAGVGLLGRHRVGLAGLLHDVVDQTGGIADLARQHPVLHIGALADDAGDLQPEGVVIEVFQAGVGLAQVVVKAGAGVVAVAGRGQDHPVILGADLLVGPPVLPDGAGVPAVGDGLHLLFGDQPQGVQGHVVQLVVFVHHQDHLVVAGGPGAIDQLVLMGDQGVDRRAVLPGQQLLPEGHHAAAHHRGHPRRGVHLPVCGVLVQAGHPGGRGGVLPHHRDQQLLDHLGGVRLDDAAAGGAGVDLGADAVGILHPAQGAAEGRRRVGQLLFQIALEALQVVLRHVQIVHRRDQLPHRRALVDRVLLVGVLLGLQVHEGLDQAGQVDAGGLDGQGIGREGVFLHDVDVVGHAPGHREDQRDADDADGPRKGGQGGAALFGEQVFEGQPERGQQGHGGLADLFAPGGLQLGGVGGPLGLQLGRGQGVRVAGQLAVQHPDDAGGILLRKGRVVGDHDDQPVPADLLQQVHDLDAGLGVQGAGGLVGQDDVGVIDDCPGNGHPLHLAAGHLTGPLEQLAAQAHLFQRVDGPVPPLGPADPRQGQGQLHVPQHGLVGDQVVALEHEPHRVVPVGVPVPVLEGFGGAPVDDQVAVGVLVQAADDVQQGGLAAARRAQDGHELRAPELDADPFQGVDDGGAHGIIFFDVA